MRIKGLFFGLLVSASASASAYGVNSSDCGNLQFRCTTDYAPATCTIGDSGVLVHGSNDCVALQKAFRISCSAKGELADQEISCETDPDWRFFDFGNNLCPVFMPPHPDFCADGTIVVDQDDNGCNLPPRCV